MSGSVPAMVALVLSAAGSGDAAPSYGRDIAPILAKRCFTCHGPDASTRQAGLRLDTPDGALRPRGRRPAAIVPGNADASAIMDRILSSDIDHRMPPEDQGHDALGQAEVELLRAWIDAGAHYEQHWSWQPLTPPDVPAQVGSTWPQGDIDRFVEAGLGEVDLAPAPEADPATRLRRLHFDLIGLPPSPDGVAEFLDDPSEEAFAAHVDRLLADPGFGETWGRHWLDLMRYAETHGHEFDYPIEEAWRYRDWVIAALNADMPWDQFVREQLAGDTHRQVRVPDLPGVPAPAVATGWWWMSQGTHGPVDVRQDELDRIDNQIDVFSRAFLGTTMACARCHDHKFDAISQQDYYAMAGVIRSSRRGYAYLDEDGDIQRRVDDLETTRADISASLAESGMPRGQTRLPIDIAGVAFVWDFGEDASAWPAWDTSGWAFDVGGGASESTVSVGESSEPRWLREGQVHSSVASSALHGTARSPSFTITRPFVHVRARGDKSRVRLYVDHFFLNERNALLFETMIQDLDHPDLWKTRTIDVSRYQGHQAYLEFVDDDDGFIAVDWVAHADALPDELTTEAVPESHALDVSQALMDRIAQITSGMPRPVRALAMEEGTRTDAAVLDRGDHRSPLEPAPRALAAAFPDGSPPDILASGRSELSDRVLDPANPLTARVAVNRVWQHLMGRGLSTTPDDLGGMGMAPAHPELLDHMAVTFQQDWDLKALIRRIVTSSTYAMASSHPDPRAYDIDPDGRLVSRALVRRVPAENLRDAMLHVAGTLDRTMGGPSVPVHLLASMQGRGRPGASGPVDGDNRRSIYIAVRRNFLDSLMAAFDAPVPSSTQGRRAVSNVPAQGLMLLNDPQVTELAARFGTRARSLEAAGMSREHVAAHMIQLAYGRMPHEGEQALVSMMIDSTDESWSDAAHALMSSAEFRYLH